MRLGYRCEACGFELWRPITELRASSLGLYDDARFPGRCLVVLRQHYEHLDEVPTELLAAFTEDVRSVYGVLRSELLADRANVAVLGNRVPHIHAHVVPRYRDFDPAPYDDPWRHPDPPRPLSPEVADGLVLRLSRALLS
jgi:diadenosine tetraphosphate (Ap4A) HIT family hydrolase